ncbi:uncharacterized protein LOC127287142 isoform X1 [Leptopilina boulardi]|uniref:uncharacterized protein LOC127287142 isoform X1 n=1 Tax=Leptopilina boulardi TaxID=63433 RepID=UPI0021F5338C|nr:uncharacterized protein LOC127287142 isoform X1 [Leptopilina boulardi]
MSSFRNYNDSRLYKPRTNVGTSNFGRNLSSINSLGSKNYEKDRLRPSRSSIDDLRSKSPGVSGRTTSIVEKYSSPSSGNSDIQFSKLDKYSRASPRATSREPEVTGCYRSSTYPGSSISRNFGNERRTEKKERTELPSVSYRSIRASSGRSSREPSPDVSNPKINSLKMYSTRTPSYGRHSVSSNVSEPSSDSLSRCASSTGGRYSLSSRNSLDRFPSTINYSSTDRIRTNNKSLKDEEEVKNKAKNSGRQLHQDELDKNVRHLNQSSVNEIDDKKKTDKSGTVSLKVVSRGTSPTQPTLQGDSRRLDKIFEKEVPRIQKSLNTKDEEVQVDRNDDSRFSRYSGSSRITSAPWATYLDRFNSSSTSPRNYTVSRLTNYGYSSPTSSRSDASIKSNREQKIKPKEKKNSDSNSKTNSASNFSKSSESKKRKSSTDDSISKSDTSCQLDSLTEETKSKKSDENEILKGQGKDFQHRSDSASSKSKSISRNSSSLKNLSRQMTRTDSSEGSVVSVPTGRLKSSSSTNSMTNHSAKIKTMSPLPGKLSSSSVSSRQVNSSDTRGKPPVAMKNTTQFPIKYVNKDFRKSVLNMENGDPMRSQKTQKKCQRSMSTSSQDSESISEATKSNSKIENKEIDNNIRNNLKKNCETSSTESSASDEEEINQQRSSSRRRRRASESPFPEGKSHMSTGSSRTSILASSADELSLTMDKPPRPPPSPRLKNDRNGKTEEAKCFLMRALAPVTGLFKGKSETGEIKADGWVHSNDTNSGSTRISSQNLSKSFNSEKNLQTSKSNSKIRHQNSGERPWWMDSNSDNVPEGIEKNDDISQETTVSTNLPDDGKFKFKVWRQDSEEKAWWIDEEDKKSSLRRGSSQCSLKSKSSDKLNHLKHQKSGERAWWMSDDPHNVPDGVVIIPVSSSKSKSEEESFPKTIGRIRQIESGERAWWMDEDDKKSSSRRGSSQDSSGSYERIDIDVENEKKRGLAKFPIEFPPPPPPDEPLGDRASPEGVENPPEPPDSYGGRDSPYDNNPMTVTNKPRKRPSTLPPFIGTHTNIDDLLGYEISPSHSPILSRLRRQKDFPESSDDSSECEEIDANQVIIHDSTPKTSVIQRRNRDSDRPQPDGYIPLDDTALQLYKDGDYGAYLDLEASISEQQEEFEGFQTNRKNSIVLRTQLSVRVHTIIEKLLNSEGRELRRALFSLKQIFQEDKDLVHEFVQNDGLACLIKVGNEADQNYQNYILRALGQVMLYVDGMNGVMEHGQTVQWLYTLIASRFRLVVKTALKLLLVFVEYVETNSLLLVRAIRSIDTSRGMIPWTNVMKLLKDYDAADTELLIYATTLVNKCLNGIPDQDTYYDQVDCLEEQGIEGIIQRYMSKQGTDLDLLRQFQIYEAVLHHEDGNDRDFPIRQLDDNIRKTLRNRKSLMDSHERRKSRRHSTGTSPLSMTLNARLSPRLNNSLGLSSLNNTLNSSLNNTLHSSIPDDDDESSSSQSSQGLGDVQMNGSYKENKLTYSVDVGVTPALRRRRERAERQKSFIREQQEATANMRASIGHPGDQESPFTTNGLRYTNGSSYDRNVDSTSNKLSRVNSRKDLTPLMNAANKLNSEEKKPWYGRSPDEGVECDDGNQSDDDQDRRVVLQLKREGTVKDLTQKLAAQNLIPSSPVEEKVSRIGDMSGLISKAKEGLAKSKSKADIVKSPTNDNLPKLAEVKKSENELHWEELINKLKRPLCLCDLDFTDLNTDDEIDVLGPVNVSNGVPPPPPPMVPPPAGYRAPPPPPPGARIPPPLPSGGPPPLFDVNLRSIRTHTTESNNSPKSPPPNLNKKNKKTVKLFWKEVRDDPIILSRLDQNKMIWDELSPIPVDTQKLEHLFESRAKDLITKKQQEMNKNKEIIVLDHKRSNAINIGMTKLPPPRSIKTAILKMDATIMNREGIEKLLTMLPTEEERSRIQEAQAANPDLPLGSAEQFLLTLASISELPARLKLWAFKLDFENSEKEIADPLMDLKQGMETLRVNKTFRGILSTLLSIGIFLNGNEVKGFQLEYLTKVPEVKDTVHKHSLLHHLCHMVMEKFPDSTDLYSEIGAVTRASKIDFDELASNIFKLESECKASWDHLKLIAKHDGSTMMKVKMSDFLADCAERIIVLSIVHRRIINRFHKFVLWLGIPLHRVQDTKPNEFCRIVSEFALEYRTTRERVIQQLEKKANHRERNKTRGKMITEVGKFRTKEDRADAELRQLLGSDISDVESLHGTLPWRRQRKEGRTSLGPLLRDETTNGNLTDGDDELLECLVKTATKLPTTRATPRERKRTRHADRKSLRRTLKNGLSEEEKKHIAAYIKGY